MQCVSLILQLICAKQSNDPIPYECGIQVTLISAAIILSFTLMEFVDYRRVTIDTSIVVDKSRGEKLTAKMNVTFPRVPCYRECYFCIRDRPPLRIRYDTHLHVLGLIEKITFLTRNLYYSFKLGRHGRQRRDPNGHFT